MLPFNISGGFCKNCERGYTNYCLTTQPESVLADAAHRLAAMGPWAGGQAELLRVPYGDHNALRLGENASERENDDVMLACIFPTGYHATELAGVVPRGLCGCVRRWPGRADAFDLVHSRLVFVHVPSGCRRWPRWPERSVPVAGYVWRTSTA